MVLPDQSGCADSYEPFSYPTRGDADDNPLVRTTLLAAAVALACAGTANGADVTVTRTVMRDGGVLFQDEFTTHYEPWQAICQYGPDSKDPSKLADEKNLCRNPAG